MAENIKQLNIGNETYNLDAYNADYAAEAGNSGKLGGYDANAIVFREGTAYGNGAPIRLNGIINGVADSSTNMSDIKYGDVYHSHAYLTRQGSSTVGYVDDIKNATLKNQVIYYVAGPATDTTAGTWTGTIPGVSAYYDGLSVLYVPAVAGASTTKLSINGLGAKTCYYNNTSKLTTQYAVGTPILLTYIGGYWKRADYNSNTTYSAGNGLTLSGTTFNVGAGTGINVTADAVGLATSGVTAGTYGPSANVTGSNNATISVPQITVDDYGRITSITNKTYTSVNTDTDTNTHYTSKNIVTNSASGTTNTTTALTNGNVYLNHLEESTVKSSHKISGSGTVSVTTDASGNIIITGADQYTGDITGVTAGSGLTGGGNSGSVTLNVGAGTGITVAADSVSAKLRSTTALTRDSVAATETADRVYPVAVDKSGYLAVNVPWTNTQRSYGSSAKAVTTSASSAGSASTVSRSDHTHQLTKSTVTSALGYTPPESVSVSQALTTGTNIGSITVNGTTTQLYAPMAGQAVTYDVFNGATASAAGTTGLVPGPTKGDVGRILTAGGTWSDDLIFTESSDYYLKASVKNAKAIDASKSQYAYIEMSDGYASTDFGPGILQMTGGSSVAGIAQMDPDKFVLWKTKSHANMFGVSDTIIMDRSNFNFQITKTAIGRVSGSGATAIDLSYPKNVATLDTTSLTFKTGSNPCTSTSSATTYTTDFKISTTGVEGSDTVKDAWKTWLGINQEIVFEDTVGNYMYLDQGGLYFGNYQDDEDRTYITKNGEIILSKVRSIGNASINGGENSSAWEYYVSDKIEIDYDSITFKSGNKTVFGGAYTTSTDFVISKTGVRGNDTALSSWKTWLGIDTIETTLNSLTNANGVSY